MSLESELTVAILSPDEDLIDYLDPDTVDITEYNTLHGLRGINISHPLIDISTQSITRYDPLLIAKNKVWRPSTCDGCPILYVIIGEKEYDFEKNIVKTYAEEVATELGQHKIFRNNEFSWTVNNAFMRKYFEELFDPGTLTGPSGTVNYNGALTPLAILRKIEEKTGGEFQFRYEYVDRKVRRYIDFMEKIGTVHNTPIEFGQNATNIKPKIREVDVRIAAGPVGEPGNDGEEFHKGLKSFEDQSFYTSTQIPLWVTLDEDGNPVNGPLAYPPYSKPAGQGFVVCNNSEELVSSYQKIQAQRRNYYKDDFEDGLYTGREDPYKNWTVLGGTATIESSNPLSGNHSLKHTALNTSSGLSVAMDTEVHKIEYTFKITNQGSVSETPTIRLWSPRYVNINNRLTVYTYYNSGTNKQILAVARIVDGSATYLSSANWLTGKLPAGTNYNFCCVDDGTRIRAYINNVKYIDVAHEASSIAYSTKALGAYNDTACLFDSIELNPPMPRIHTFETSETNKYNIYWECVKYIREYLNPDVEIDADVIDIDKITEGNPNRWNVGDTVYIKIPSRSTLIQSRIVESEKNVRKPEEDRLSFGSPPPGFISRFLNCIYHRQDFTENLQ